MISSRIEFSSSDIAFCDVIVTSPDTVFVSATDTPSAKIRSMAKVFMLTADREVALVVAAAVVVVVVVVVVVAFVVVAAGGTVVAAVVVSVVC